VILPITVEFVRSVRVVVDGRTETDTTVRSSAPTTTVTTAPPTTTTTTTTTPPPTTTTTTAPPPTGDAAHTPILDDDAYRLTVRAVHDKINAAIGFGRNDLTKLDGGAELLEGLLGQDPDLDDELQGAIAMLRRAQDEEQRDWAIYAHRIIEDIERQRAAR
jgi:hypothetical protein